MTVDALLQSIPPLTVYVVVGLVVGIESLGIPLPGEIVLVSAALLSSRHELAVNQIGVGVAAVIGAVVGDSTGYAIGRRLGLPLFDRLGRRFPNHFGPGHIALLRIFGGPLAGALKMRYGRFLVANVSGAVCWAGGTTALVYYAGVAAERWLTRFSWIALVVAVVCGVIAAVLLRERVSRAVAELEAEHSTETGHTSA